MYNGVYTIEQFAYAHDTLAKWLDMKVHGDSLGSRLENRGIKRVAVYGTNDFGRLVYDDIKSDVEVEAFVDRKAADSLITIDGVKALPPNGVEVLSSDCYVLVTPEYYFREISEELSRCGISDERIISIAMVVS